MEQSLKLARWLKAAAMLMAAITACTAALELWMIDDLEQWTQQTESAVRSASTDAQAFRSIAASALDGAQGMTRIALAGMLVAIGVCAMATVVLFAAAGRLATKRPEMEGKEAGSAR